MTENFSNFDLDREDAFSTISSSQFSLINERPETIVGSTSNLDYQREFTKEVVKNALLENQNKALIEQVEKSNEMIKCLNEKFEEMASDLKQLKEEKIKGDVEINKELKEINSKMGTFALESALDGRIGCLNLKIKEVDSGLKEDKLKSNIEIDTKFEEINLKINKLNELEDELNKLKEKIKLGNEINGRINEVLLPELNKLKEDKLISDRQIVDLNRKTDEFMNNLGNNKCLIEINKKIKELSIDMEILKIKVVYKYMENKWKYIDDYKCCDNNCVNNNNPNGLCSKGNGYIQIESNTKIEWINCKGNGENKSTIIETENYFNKPVDELIQTFTLYYFEVKLIKENEQICIGLRNGHDNICLTPNNKLIYYSFQNNPKYIKHLPLFTYKTNDIIGCGLVYPPPKLNNKLPYIFFTQNGKQIGKVMFEGNCESIRPFVELYCCSLETNFGGNLFNYDVSSHYVTEGFYKEE